jgi:hypothetical protein
LGRQRSTASLSKWRWFRKSTENNAVFPQLGSEKKWSHPWCIRTCRWHQRQRLCHLARRCRHCY